MLDVVHEGTAFEYTVLGFLMGEEDPRELAQRRKLASRDPKAAAAKAKQHQSSALILLQSTTAGLRSLQPDGASSYFTLLGRFTLKDLLALHVHSTSAPTATAALKLLQGLLRDHDRWSLGLLDVVLDESATSFPIPLREEIEEESDEDEPFVYTGVDSHVMDDSSDDDDFPRSGATPATPSGLPLSGSRATLTPLRPAQTPSKLPSLVVGTPTAPTLSVRAHHQGLDALLALVGTIDPSYRRARASGSGAEMVSAGFDNYLKDAEAAMTADKGFRRGLAVKAGEGREKVELPPKARRRSTLFGPASAELSARELAAARTMYRHTLKPEVGLTAVLLDSLSHFFSHSPDLNLQLTAALAALALCPYRSVQGWLLPETSRLEATTLAELVARDKDGASDDDGDDRSVDYDVEHLAKQAAPGNDKAPPSFGPTSFLVTLTGSQARSKVADDSVLSILAALASSVSDYRGAINNFDQYLSERRQGLFFVENLTDALDLDDESGNAFGEAVKTLATATPPRATPPASVSSAPDRPPKGLGFGAFLSPRVNKTLATATDVFSTPPRKASHLSRSASIDSFDASAQAGSSSIGPASPFAAHYKQTGSISVKPVIVATPSALRRAAAAVGLDDEAGDESVQLDGTPESPTKRVTPGSSVGRAGSSAMMSEEGSEAGGAERRAKASEVKAVTLSVILDNVIVLEEFIKEVGRVILRVVDLSSDLLTLGCSCYECSLLGSCRFGRASGLISSSASEPCASPVVRHPAPPCAALLTPVTRGD